jgi:hypothetical protein
MRRRTIVIAGVVLVVAVTSLVLWRAQHVEGAVVAGGAADTTRAPTGERIVVEVLNASGVPGQARRATFLLRDRGYDVVGWGNDRTRRDGTVIEDHTGRPEAAERLARILGGAAIERGAPTSRYLDLTVRLGSAWRPPAQPFHP